MQNKKKVLAICGSIRKESSNLLLLRAIEKLAIDSFSMDLFEGLAELPHFNPDLDDDNPPIAVIDLRRKLTASDGIIICTPEYAMGLPGVLKNAIDWTVSSCEFSNKPVLAITASSSGAKAHRSLLDILQVIEANVTESTQLLIPFIKTRIDKEGKITHKETMESIIKAIDAFENVLNE